MARTFKFLFAWKFIFFYWNLKIALFDTKIQKINFGAKIQSISFRQDTITMVTKKFPKSKLTNLWFVYWKNAKSKLIKSLLEIKPIGNEDQDSNKGQRPRMSARNKWLIILNRLKENWVPKKPKTSTTNWSSVVNPKPEVNNHLGEPMVWVLSFINVNVILTPTKKIFGVKIQSFGIFSW